MLTLYTPCGEPSKDDRTIGISPRLSSLAGRTVAIVSNQWKCMDVIALEFKRLLVERYKAKDAIIVPGSATMPLPDAAVRMIQERCDAAIVGIGN